MTIEDIEFSIILRKYELNTVRSNRISRHNIKDMITKEGDFGYYINHKVIQAIDDESSPPEPVW